MANDREELQALRRLAELEARAAGQLPATAKEAPGSAPLPSFAERMGRMGMAGLRGMITGGPIGVVGQAGAEGMRQFQQGVDRAAYQGGGFVTDKSMELGASPEVAATAGYLTNLGTQAIPVWLGGLTGKAVGEKPMEDTAKRLMTSALKPSRSAIESGDAAAGVQTMLEKGANVSAGGTRKLINQVRDLGGEADDLVQQSHGIVGMNKPAEALGDTLRRFSKQGTPAADRAAIMKDWREFLDTYGPTLSVQRANDIKRGTQTVLSGKYGELGSASTEAQKAIARGLRLAIEEQVPGVAEKNKEISSLINALELVSPRQGVAANRDIAGLAMLAKTPEQGAVMMADRSSLLKSILARALYASRQRVPETAGELAGAYVGMKSGANKEE